MFHSIVKMFLSIITYLYSYPRMSICNNHNDSFSIIFCTFEINIKSLDSWYKLIKNAIQS